MASKWKGLVEWLLLLAVAYSRLQGAACALPPLAAATFNGASMLQCRGSTTLAPADRLPARSADCFNFEGGARCLPSFTIAGFPKSGTSAFW